MKQKAKELVNEIRTYCKEHENPAMAGKWARYFSEGYDSWGLLDKGNPFFTTKKAEWLEKYRSIGLDGFLDTGAELCKSGKYEEGAISISFLKTFLEDFDEKSLLKLEKWFDGGIRNWAHVDVLCGEVLSPAYVAGSFTLEALARWRKSVHKYQRRASVVTLIAPLKGQAKFDHLLKYIRPLMEDPEKPVQQALGWFLREVWKLSPKPVEEFLLEHIATAPRQIVQTATEKMSAERKALFKRPAKNLR